jgi:hypothetical protein
VKSERVCFTGYKFAKPYCGDNNGVSAQQNAPNAIGMGFNGMKALAEGKNLR